MVVEVDRDSGRPGAETGRRPGAGGWGGSRHTLTPLKRMPRPGAKYTGVLGCCGPL